MKYNCLLFILVIGFTSTFFCSKSQFIPKTPPPSPNIPQHSDSKRIKEIKNEERILKKEALGKIFEWSGQQTSSMHVTKQQPKTDTIADQKK